MVAVLDETHSQILAYRQVRKNGAPLRNIADAGTSATKRRHLADVGIPESNRAPRERNLPDQRLEKRCLAHAVMPEHPHDLMLSHRESDSRQHGNASIPFVS